ncbi:MAG: cupin domain-containing protein, partial [Clostridia bacterium]|nr:cupin domain-containing protein [Clostridia bacterium]
AQRMKALRELLELSVEDMAKVTQTDVDTYEAYENGEKDFEISFLYKCAKKFGVDPGELLTGENPKLTKCSVVRAGKGLNVKRRKGFVYEHLAYKFRNKIAEPLLVTAPYIEADQRKPIRLSTHAGQEMDYILTGQLKIEVDGHTQILNPGDCIYYDSSKEHGMIAVGNMDCVFLAIVMREENSDKEDKYA